MNKYAYIRVSTKDQHIDRQLSALIPYDIPQNHIFCDFQSGKDFSRPAYGKLMKKLKQHDLLIIKSIDRLGRNYSEILEQWRYITKKIGADILVVDMPLLDTRSKSGDLTGVFIADLVLQILAYVAQTEREFIRQRQAEGICAAKKKGVPFGRRPLLLPPEFETTYQLWKSGEHSLRSLASVLGVSHSTFYRWCKNRDRENCIFL